jgi:hypothetical protein
LLNLQLAYDAADRNGTGLRVPEAITGTPTPANIGYTHGLESEFTNQLVRMQAGAGAMTAKPKEETTPDMLIAGRN